MARAVEFVTRRRGASGSGKGWHWTDVFTWVWLIGGLFIMFAPAAWLTRISVAE